MLVRRRGEQKVTRPAEEKQAINSQILLIFCNLDVEPIINVESKRTYGYELRVTLHHKLGGVLL